MTVLAVAVAAWIGIHLLVAGRFRPSIAGALGEVAFRGLFSTLSVASLAFLVWSWAQAPFVELWPAGAGLRHVALAIMPFAFVFVVTALTTPNPTLAGPDVVMKGDLPVTGMVRITRHPMLWGFALWSAAHILANGDLAALLFFGAVLVVALNGMVSIDAKRARAFGAAWERFAAVTSRVPFVAIAGGRNRVVLAEIGLWRIALALALYAAVVAFHGRLFGVAILPG